MNLIFFGGFTGYYNKYEIVERENCAQIAGIAIATLFLAQSHNFVPFDSNRPKTATIQICVPNYWKRLNQFLLNIWRPNWSKSNRSTRWTCLLLTWTAVICSNWIWMLAYMSWHVGCWHVLQNHREKLCQGIPSCQMSPEFRNIRLWWTDPGHSALMLLNQLDWQVWY